MKQLLIGIAALSASLLMLSAGTAFAASLISNGSFETGTAPGSFLTLTAPNTTDIPNWSVDSGTVDYIGTYWTSADGVRSLDMSGNDVGSISQTFATAVGVPYTVTFDLSGNPDGAPALKDLQVNATGGSPQDFTFDTSAMGNTDANMMWQPETYTFTASSASTKLSFTSETAGSFGPALDNVAVTSTASSPPPANACNTPSVAPAGFTLKNGTPGSGTYALVPMTMFVAAAGSPKITGPAGNYIVCLQSGSATVTLGDGSDTITTGSGNPNITVGSGGSGSSTITTGSGNSTIKSTDSGNQTVTVGNGSSNITTGAGNDTIKAGAGNSTINAGAGTDSCTVGPGHSTLTNCNP